MSKTKKYVLTGVILMALMAVSFGVGYSCQPFVSPAPPAPVVTSIDPGVKLEVVDQVWNIIFRDYVDKTKFDAAKLSQGAIKGMLEVLDDPYTSYLDADNYKLSVSGLQGEFEGIGAQVAMRDEKITIIAPIPDTPAARAGIRPGDVILEVDGKSTKGMSIAEAVLLIRGKKGTPVNLVILHEGEIQSIKLQIIRDKIEVTSVRFEMKGDIAYINITHFSERTAEELLPALQKSKGAKGIILDLRSNPGGLLETVVDVASYFLKEGVVVTMVDSQGKRTPYQVRSKELTIELPIVVLVDSFSASGSEVLAGVLMDYGRATIAGTKTFGKGSVNVLRQLKDGSGLYITTGRWLTPKDHLIEGEGIEPDRELELKGDEATQWAIDFLEGSK